MSSFHILKALPSLSPPFQCKCKNRLLSISCEQNQNQYVSSSSSRKQVSTSFQSQPHASITNKIQDPRAKIVSLAVQVGGVLATVAQPAFAVTGVNEGEDLIWILIQSGISAFLYFIVFPPIIMNWLRTRWYKRNLLEMYVQFMFVFIFYPGVLLWAPFLNFRKFPRDPSMKYPWSTPQDPSQIKGGFLKYPWAQPEDYE
ncbi:NAD(P)H-quinone oxidoreductase subunit L, chloroplastic [Sesamum indicum]|uniref:NAD(P)H-quinone oxidoreductase subunit L, chloroplastic n=1 Tax=Sesamum indicum TaxID=4182 RepID=A0A6I9SYJ7_SESIN|nr:NAD(P)H-quinone oxidoreductase subunit L, chloroplastic [Sesamum indicum]